MIKKRILSIFLLSTFILSLSGCKFVKQSLNIPDTTTNKQTEPSIIITEEMLYATKLEVIKVNENYQIDIKENGNFNNSIATLSQYTFKNIQGEKIIKKCKNYNFVEMDGYHSCYDLAKGIQKNSIITIKPIEKLPSDEKTQTTDYSGRLFKLDFFDFEQTIGSNNFSEIKFTPKKTATIINNKGVFYINFQEANLVNKSHNYNSASFCGTTNEIADIEIQYNQTQQMFTIKSEQGVENLQLKILTHQDATLTTQPLSGKHIEIDTSKIIDENAIIEYKIISE